MLNLAKRLWREESGQGMAEYGLILALIAVVVMGTLAAIGGSINTQFGKISSKLSAE